MPDYVEESFHNVALLLAHAVQEGVYRSVIFASAKKGAGSTTIVLRVARELKAVHGLRPLVVELDGRSRGMTQLLSLDAKRSLTAIADMDCAVSEFIQKDSHGVHVIPSGPKLVGGGVGRTLRRVLEETARTADLVLVDAPPVLENAMVVAAGAVIPRLVVVVEAGRTTFEELEAVKRTALTSNISMLGTVLNKHRGYIPRWLSGWLAG